MSNLFSTLLYPAGRPARRAALWAALAALVLSGCGPGTGGTGNGETGSASALEYFGASPANVCLSGPASALACPPPGNTGSVGAEQPSVPFGTDGVLFADTPSSDNTVLSLGGNRATLTSRCQSLAFEGDWGAVGGNNPRYFGHYTVGRNGQQTLSTLTIQASGADGKGLTATLHDREGRVVLGPVLLRRVVIPVPGVTACPG